MSVKQIHEMLRYLLALVEHDIRQEQNVYESNVRRLTNKLGFHVRLHGNRWPPIEISAKDDRRT